ncbi:MAG: class I SAM-dependent methyltransferase [Oscillospiraceae bacterium]|nr:class I SAM-dependent methyltransferase [Oscillospiraceae bacterium]
MNEEKFTGKADLYDKFRPGYPDSLIDFLYENAKCDTVADIGAGTGKFTRCLLKKPWRVIAVEPNADMRGKLSDIEGISVVSASAENTGLDARSVGLVTVAQAFHWFDENLFKAECERILTENGQLAVVFNERVLDGCEISRLRNEICMRYCGAFHTGHVGRRSSEEGDAFLRGEYFSEVKCFSADNDMVMDEQSFIGDTLSRSYAIGEDHADHGRFVGELKDAFAKYEKDGVVTIKCRTKCYLGRFLRG